MLAVHFIRGGISMCGYQQSTTVIKVNERMCPKGFKSRL